MEACGALFRLGEWGGREGGREGGRVLRLRERFQSPKASLLFLPSSLPPSLPLPRWVDPLMARGNAQPLQMGDLWHVAEEVRKEGREGGREGSSYVISIENYSSTLPSLPPSLLPSFPLLGPDGDALSKLPSGLCRGGCQGHRQVWREGGREGGREEEVLLTFTFFYTFLPQRSPPHRGFRRRRHSADHLDERSSYSLTPSFLPSLPPSLPRTHRGILPIAASSDDDSRRTT